MKSFIICIIGLIFYCTNAQEYCAVNFSASSGERSLLCKYCDESVKFTIPIKIKFKTTRMCETYNNPNQATLESKCKYNSLSWYITYSYFKGWYESNSFASEKCYGLKNPKNNHAAYQGYDRETGIKNFSFEDYEVEQYLKFMVEVKKYIDISSYNEGLRLSANYSRLVIYQSCN